LPWHKPELVLRGSGTCPALLGKSSATRPRQALLFLALCTGSPATLPPPHEGCINAMPV